MSGALVLVIEDDMDICYSLEVVFGRAGYRTVTAGNGAEGLRVFRAEHPDLVILDVGLPVMDGWTVLEHIRDVSQVPVLVLTARGLETDKARGLLSGADDYLTKPYGNSELVARVGALLRRTPAGTTTSHRYQDARLQVDFEARSVVADGVAVSLTPTEFRLLALLVREAGQILSPLEILERGWHDPSGIGTGRVKFTILNLRRKLGWTTTSPAPIETVRGFGYRYRAPT